MNKREICGECGMELKSMAEYHPLSFCRLYQAGFSPWQFLADTLWDRGWEKQAIDILDRFKVRDMNMKRPRIHPHGRKVAAA